MDTTASPSFIRRATYAIAMVSFASSSILFMFVMLPRGLDEVGYAAHVARNWQMHGGAHRVVAQVEVNTTKAGFQRFVDEALRREPDVLIGHISHTVLAHRRCDVLPQLRAFIHSRRAIDAASAADRHEDVLTCIAELERYCSNE